MNILLKYIRKYHWMNKLSTLLAVVSISVASCLFFVMICLGINSMIGMNEMIVSSYGNYHAYFSDASDDLIESLRLHGQIDQIDIVGLDERISYDFFQKIEKDSFQLFEMDETVFQNLGFLLDEGHFPEKENEILISDATIYESKAKMNLNETIELNNQQYLICGIISTPFLEENQSFYTIVKPIDNATRKDVYVHYKNVKTAVETTTKIKEDFVGMYETYHINQALLGSSIFQIKSVSSTVLIMTVFIVIAFLAVNLMLIRNAFKNSYANREKHLAILKTIGVTRLQCEKMILYEGFTLMISGIIIGLSTGWFLYLVLCQNLNQLLKQISSQTFQLGCHHMSIVLLVSALYVFVFSSFFIRRSTHKMISKSVSSTLQSNDEVVVMNRPYLQLDSRHNILIRLFKKNIRQNFRSYRHLLLGCIAIMTLLILVNGLMGYLRETGFFDLNDHNYDVELILKEDHYPTSLMTQLKNSEYASNSVIAESIHVDSKDVQILDHEYFENTLLQDHISFEIISYSDELLKKYALKDFKKLKDLQHPCGILINQVYNSASRRFYDILNTENIEHLYYEDSEILSSLSVILTDTLISGTSYQKNPQIIVSRDLFAQIFQQSKQPFHEIHVFFQSTSPASLVRELNSYDTGELMEFDIINANETLHYGSTMITLIRLLGYGYVLILMIMGALAALCVTTTNFEYRHKEMALFHILGLRIVDMMKLVLMELLFYIGIIFGCSWILSQTINYILYKKVFASFGMTFFLPFNSLAGSLLLAVLALLFMLSYFYIKMKLEDYSSVLKNEISLM